MIGVDTSVVVRLLVADDRVQTAKARSVFETEEVFISTTVLIETAWVLGSVYGSPQSAVVTALRALAGLRGVVVEGAQAVSRALDWAWRGLDFADALHLARAEGCDAFVSFDRQFIRAASALGAMQVRLP